MERRRRAKLLGRQRHSSVASSQSDAVAGEPDANAEANPTVTPGAAPSAGADSEGRRPPRKERKSSRRMTNSTSYSNYVPGAAPPPPAPPRGGRFSSRARAPTGSDSSLERLPRTQSLEHLPFPFNPFAFRAQPMAPRPRAPFFPTATAPLSSQFGPPMTPFHPGLFFPRTQFGGIPHFPASASPFRPFGPPAPVSSVNSSANASVVYVPFPVPVFCPPSPDIIWFHTASVSLGFLITYIIFY